MSSTQIVRGDDRSLPVTLTKGGSRFTIDGAATVQATFVTPNRQTQLIAAFNASSGAGGANWGSSLVILELTEEQTEALPAGEALIEIQVDDGGKLTWFVPVTIIDSTIQ